MRRRRQFYAFTLLFAFIGQFVNAAGGTHPALIASTPVENLRTEYDVIVAGGGTGGIAAALQAARLGASVLIVEPTDWIGGQLAAAGVTSMDEGYPPRDRVRKRGIYREFCQRANAYYSAIGKSTDTPARTENHFGVEPHIARRLFHDMIADTRHQLFSNGERAILDVSLGARVIHVERQGNTVVGVTVQVDTGDQQKRLKVPSKILIDATEYGDVIPMAGLNYRIGTWTSGSNGVSGRNGISGSDHSTQEGVPPVQPITWTAVIREYPNGAPGELLLQEAPPGYGKTDLGNFLNQPGIGTHKYPWSWERFLKYRAMPDSTSPFNATNGSGLVPTRTHVNFGPMNDQPFDVLDVEIFTRRQSAEYKARLRTLSVIYHFQHVMGMTNWAVANDEGYDTPYNVRQVEQLIEGHPEIEKYRPTLIHFPIIPYVRESRRIMGKYTLKARDVRRKHPHQPRRFSTAVAMGDYPVDVHGGHARRDLQVEQDIDQEEDLPLRWIQWGYGPFQIPLDSFIPVDVDGFLPAEKNLSQSRIVSGATRLQPVTMLTGQASGAIAGLACKLGKTPREVPAVLVQKVLLDAGSTLSFVYYDDIIHGTELWKSIQLATLYEVVDFPEPLFKESRKITPKEIEEANEKLAALKLSGATPGWRKTAGSKMIVKTRSELARAVAQKILSAYDLE